MEFEKILVDTSVLIEFLRKQDKSKTLLYSLIDKYTLTISSITIFELYAGAINIQKKNDIDLVTEYFEVIPFSSEIAFNAANIFRELKKNNLLIEIRDLFIASTSSYLKIPIATLNKKHFERVKNIVVIF